MTGLLGYPVLSCASVLSPWPLRFKLPIFPKLPLPSVSIFTMVIPFLLWYTICGAFRAYT